MSEKKHKLAWLQSVETLLQRNPGLKKIDDPEKLEYYRTDLNVDLPPLNRDLMLKSLPDLILQPTTEEHLFEIFAMAREHKLPLTVRGAGTWGYGGAVPTRGGILIDLSLMNTIDINIGVTKDANIVWASFELFCFDGGVDVSVSVDDGVGVSYGEDTPVSVGYEIDYPHEGCH